MALVTKELNKEKNNNGFTKDFQTGQIERIERVLVDTIPLATYFDNEMQSFCATYTPRGKIDIDFEIDITESSMEIVSREYVYQSDGKQISDREPTCNDVILFYVNVRVPVENIYEEEYLGYYHLDLNPTPGHMHTVSQNGFHQWIPIDIDSEPGFVTDAPNRDLLVKQINVYMRPICIRQNDENGTKIHGTDKVQTIYHTDEDHWFDPKDANYDPSMLRLGKIIVHANSNIKDNLTILDTRTRGGGLDESLSKEIIKKVNKESMYHWDIGYFDGEAYQENGVMVIRLPNTLLDQFSKSQIEAAVAKHKAYGNLPIIEYYDPKEITNRRYGILSNYEFTNGEHVTYYDPELTTKAEIVYDSNFGTGDNYVLELKDNNVYGITIPNYVIEDMSGLQINLKCFRSMNDTVRKAGTVNVIYTDGTKQTVNLPQVNFDSRWQIIEQAIQFEEDKEIERVQLILNDTALSTRGRILYDYVDIKAYQEFDEQNAEIHEI